MEEKRINGGYEIIESCTIGNNELGDIDFSALSHSIISKAA